MDSLTPLVPSTRFWPTGPRIVGFIAQTKAGYRVVDVLAWNQDHIDNDDDQ